MKPSFRILVMGLLMAGFGLAASHVSACILQYKYEMTYDSSAGVLQKRVGYLLVLTDPGDGFYDIQPVICILNREDKIATIAESPTTWSHGFRPYVTARGTGVLFSGKKKTFSIRGRLSDLTPFNWTFQHVAPTLLGQELSWTSNDQWYVTRKSTLKLDKARTKAYIEAGDNRMDLAVDNLQAWLESKGYMVVSLL
jgi:hypothetical protein